MKNTLKMGQTAVSVLESAGWVVIALATLVAFGQEILVMVRARTVTLADLLLLFIYLEVLAMAAIYLKSGQLPVRLPLYIGMVALARYLVLDMKDMDQWKIMAVGATMFTLIRVPEPGATGSTDTVAGLPNRSPDMKTNLVSAFQGQVPVLRTRQVLVKDLPGGISVPSGTVTSATKAESNVQSRGRETSRAGVAVGRGGFGVLASSPWDTAVGFST